MTTTNMFLNFGGKWDSPPIYVYTHVVNWGREAVIKK